MADLEAPRPKKITSDKFHAALVAAGVIREGEHIRRIVIDAQAGYAIVMYLERLGDDRLLSVVQTLDGVEIREEHRAEARVPAPELDGRAIKQALDEYGIARGDHG